MTIEAENKIIDRVLAGEQDAFAALYDAHQKAIRSTIASIVYKRGGFTAVEDVTQETFLRAYLKLSSFRRGSRFGTWLHRIAVNLSLIWLRTTKTKAYSSLHSVSLDDASPESYGAHVLNTLKAVNVRLDESIDASDAFRVMIEVVGELAEPLRLCFVGHYLEEKSIAEVAKETGKSIAATKSDAIRSKRQVAGRMQQVALQTR